MGETFKKFVTLVIAIITVITTVVAFLQNDAGNRDDAAGRDANRLAIEILGRKIEGTTQVNYDYDDAYETAVSAVLQATTAEQLGSPASTIQRYYDVAETLRGLSPLLQAPYFNEETGETDVALYETDVYLRDVVRMGEEFTAAANVKDGWDTKANAYVLHLTILAVSLFLFGLAATIENRLSQIIFAITGSAFAIVASGGAIQTYFTPVFDLRTVPQAIAGYAEGVTLAYQGRNEEALKAFDGVVTAVSDYTAAYRERGYVQMSLGNYEAAIADMNKARELGDGSAIVAGNIAYSYHLLGRFDEAIAMGQEALNANGAELWVQFDIGLNTLAAGRIEAAQAEYQKGMDQASQTVADAVAAGQQPSSSLWWSLNDAALGLYGIIYTIETGEGTPALTGLADPEAVKTAAQALLTKIRSLSVSLEYYNKPPSSEVTAQITDVRFGQPIYQDDGSVEYNVSDEFSGIAEVSALFSYSGMEDGKDLIVKVYINEVEDPSWRIIYPWDGGTSGDYHLPLAIAYSNTFTLVPAEYVVEFYVDGQLVQTSLFNVTE